MVIAGGGEIVNLRLLHQKGPRHISVSFSPFFGEKLKTKVKLEAHIKEKNMKKGRLKKKKKIKGRVSSGRPVNCKRPKKEKKIDKNKGCEVLFLGRFWSRRESRNVVKV